MIAVEGLTKLYGEFVAVSELSFAVQPGQVLGLVGPNGAGKTTTLRCLAGIIPPTRGTIHICGHDLARAPVAAKQELAFFTDEPRLFDYLTVAQHLAFTARIYQVRDYQRIAQPLLEELEIADKADKLPGELSRGMKQKLVIACGLLHAPKAIFFDEPLTGLDPLGIRRMKDSILRRAREGAAIIISSHLLHLLEEVCSHVLILKNGRKVIDGTLTEIRRIYAEQHGATNLEEVFFHATGEGGRTAAHTMIGALAFLLLNSWKNRTLLRFRRLKQPKYLVGAIFGAAYFYFYFFRFLFHSGRTGRGPGMALAGGWPADMAFFLETLGALVLFAFVVMGWVFPHDRAALVFTEAEVAFLFPAPISRRKLIHYKLLKSQIGILFGTLILTLVTGRMIQGGAAFYRVLAWWLILSTLNLHFLGASFARTLLLDRGISNWLRRIIVLGLVGGLVAWVGLWAWRTMPPAPAFTGEGDADLATLHYYARQLTEFGPVPYVLYPFRLVVRPYFATNAMAFLQAVWPVAILLALHYLWVVRANVAFEEASVEASRKLAERITAFRSGRRLPVAGAQKKKRPPFRLAPTGLPAVALLWKNLIAAGQGFTFRFWLVILWLAVVLGCFVAPQMHGGGHSSWQMVLGPMALGLLGMSFLMGPQVLRQDFRQDLPMTDVLRTYPMAGWQVALGELLAPAAILTAVQWCLILFAALSFPAMPHDQSSFANRVALAFSLAILAPVLNLVSLIIPNASVLLFPGWFQSGREATTAGIEATGQRIVFMIGQLLALVVSLLPGAILATIAILGGRALGFPISLTIPLAAVGATVIMAVEAGVGLWFLGRLFERYDLAAEGPVG